MFENKFNNLSEMLESEEWQNFISDKLGNDLFFSDPERAERIHEYAENGSNGSMHCEVIGDWRDFLSSIGIYDDDDPFCNYDALIDVYTESIILNEINACEEWHIKNNSYEQIIN